MAKTKIFNINSNGGVNAAVAGVSLPQAGELLGVSTITIRRYSKILPIPPEVRETLLANPGEVFVEKISTDEWVRASDEVMESINLKLHAIKGNNGTSYLVAADTQLKVFGLLGINYATSPSLTIPVDRFSPEGMEALRNPQIIYKKENNSTSWTPLKRKSALAGGKKIKVFRVIINDLYELLVAAEGSGQAAKLLRIPRHYTIGKEKVVPIDSELAQQALKKPYTGFFRKLTTNSKWTAVNDSIEAKYRFVLFGINDGLQDVVVAASTRADATKIIGTSTYKMLTHSIIVDPSSPIGKRALANPERAFKQKATTINTDTLIDIDKQLTSLSEGMGHFINNDILSFYFSDDDVKTLASAEKILKSFWRQVQRKSPDLAGEEPTQSRDDFRFSRDTYTDKAILALAVTSNPKTIQHITYRIRTAIGDVNKAGGLIRAKKLIDEYYEKAIIILHKQIQASVDTESTPPFVERLNTQVITNSTQLMESQKPLLAIIESLLDSK